ncbi:hypothetical protein [Endozoicomonas sp. ONNA2]|uniref:hypothetical protein n=1 Tax=Endozoicomonas sp. ONNA2 TaxID=2828741 RepID=UPI002147AC8D|nr:hypothetical protein [Endozoicomonas sp. ONNA2]
MKELDNLVKINKLKPEPPDAQEFAGMVRAAEIKLKDAAISGLSADSQFSLAYSAAHALGRIALAWLPLRKSLPGISVSTAHIRIKPV